MSHKLQHLLDNYWQNPTSIDTSELINFVENMVKANGVFTTINTVTIENYNIHSTFHINGVATDLND